MESPPFPAAPGKIKVIMIENESNGVTPTPAASSETTGNIENTPAPVIETPEAPKTEQPQEGVVDAGKPSPEVPEHFRKGYEALEKDVKERYKPMAEIVEQVGGIEVINALKPLADILLNESADPTTVVTTLQQTLLPQHLEAIAWAAIDSPETQQVLLEDPDIRKVISDKFFGGRSLDQVQAILQTMEADDLDPKTLELQTKLSNYEKAQKEADQRQQAVLADQRTQELQKRFFVDTADDVVKQFNLNAPDGASETDRQMFIDTVEDLRYAAQGRFLKDNSDAYLQIQDMYARGFAPQARIAEARLQNKWQATLIKTAERHSKQLEALANKAKVDQTQKINEIRPDISGNVPNTPKTENKPYDLNDPNWLNSFLAEFKRDAALRA